jgi:hypothetical protein
MAGWGIGAAGEGAVIRRGQGPRTQSGHALVIATSGRQALGYTELTGVVGGATPVFGWGESATRCWGEQVKEVDAAAR